jgi:thiol-disulfide isomerase/thioredoxin
MFQIRIAIILIFLYVFYLPAQGGENLAIIKIKLNDSRGTKIILYQTVEGNKVEYASVQNNGNKDIAFAVPVLHEGFYYLADQTGWWFVRIYLKPNDHLELSIQNSGMYQVIKGSPENKLLHEWFLKVAEVVMPGNNRTDTTSYLAYYPRVNKMLKSAPGFKKNVQTGNRKFNKLLSLLVDIEVEHAALLYCFSPRMVQPSIDALRTFLTQFLANSKYCDAGLLHLGEGVSLLGLYATANYVLLADDEKIKMKSNPAITCNLFCNDTLKGAYIVSRFPNYRFYDDFISKVVPVKKFLVTDHQLELFDKKLNSMDTALSKGRPSYNFSFPDTKGDPVAMKDLKGKVVLVDAWATWCVPCREEIPHLKKLEEEFHDKNVAFVSISFDEVKDKDKWKKQVRDENLTGIQLFAAGFKNAMAEFYKISGIPRFLVFDQEGKIVSIDAPRPSDPQLKNLLEELLLKQK